MLIPGVGPSGWLAGPGLGYWALAGVTHAKRTRAAAARTRPLAEHDDAPRITQPLSFERHEVDPAGDDPAGAVPPVPCDLVEASRPRRGERAVPHPPYKPTARVVNG